MVRLGKAVPMLLALGVAAAPSGAAAAEGDQPEVLIAPGARYGGWGGPVLELTQVLDEAAVLVGGRGGWLINRKFTIGGGGFGLVNPIRAPGALQATVGRVREIGMGYGGGWIEYTTHPLKLVHLTFGTLVGGGSVTLMERDGGTIDDDGFFVLEPQAAFELNVARIVRADLGVSYRWIAGADLGGAVKDSDLTDWGVQLTLKFGSF